MTTTLLALSDIARLAMVQRPVVSMWRTRSRDSALPFPTANTQRDGQELFELNEVLDWLKATERGNNPQLEVDAAAFAVTNRADMSTLSALLVLRALGDQSLAGQDRDDLLDLADEVDPDDLFCYSEIDSVDERLESLATFTDQLVDACYGVAPAIEQLFALRHRFSATALTLTSLSEEARQLIATAALELAGGFRMFREVTPGGSDLLVAVAALLGESGDGSLALATSEVGTSSLQRLALRRLYTHTAGRDNLSLLPHSPLGLATVHLAQYPSPEEPDSTDEEILQAIDELILQLHSQDCAVVVAPASLLIDKLNRSSSESARSAILRSGRLRAAVRLPRGLVTSKPRQALGLWLLGPEPTAVPVGERGVIIADLTDQKLEQAVMDDLAMDMAAALSGSEAIRGHAFRFARLIRTSSLLASSAGLLPKHQNPPVFLAGAQETPAEALVLLEKAISEINSSLQSGTLLDFAFAVRAPDQTPNNTAAVPRTLQELNLSGDVKILAGTRLDDADLDSAANQGLRVWEADSLDGSSRRQRISPLLLAERYPAAKLTEPGDIVFRAGQNPTAIVDRDGASLVRFPLRIARITPKRAHGLVPDILAKDICGATSSEWKRWEIRSVPATQLSGLSQALNQIQLERQAAEQRLRNLEEIETRLVNALSEGKLEMMNVINGVEGRP